MNISRLLPLAVAVLLAVPISASAATLRLDAPREIDRAESFRVNALGTAKPLKAYYLSVLYHDDDQGRCAPTVEKEVTRNEHFRIFYFRKVITDGDGRFDITSRTISGGDRETSGKFCGYLTNKDGENKDTAVRRIDFT